MHELFGDAKIQMNINSNVAAAVMRLFFKHKILANAYNTNINVICDIRDIPSYCLVTAKS